MESTEPAELGSGPPGSIPGVLKKLMENPPPPKFLEENGHDKVKSSEEEEEEGGGGGSGGLAEVGASASLVPAIWDRTIPYDGQTFHLEYMDLDEFLMENGISTALEEELQRSVSEEEEEEEEEEAPRTGSELEEPEGTEERGETDPHSQEPEPVLSPSCPSPVDPDRVEVQVDFQPDPADLVLSTVPGGELFNPRVHRFSEDELKPQPMIKKAKKVFVPEEKKDDKYWSRRSKNNVAAKRSRDARRLKENQITVRAAFLEKENAALRAEAAQLRRDCGRSKNELAKYRDKYGPL